MASVDHYTVNSGYLSGCKLFYVVYVRNREAFFTILKITILSASDFETAM